jgi:hypothetical protein
MAIDQVLLEQLKNLLRGQTVWTSSFKCFHIGFKLMSGP